MSIDFPANPTVDQTYTANGKTYTWTGVKWTIEVEGGTTGTVTDNTLDLSTGKIFELTVADQTIDFSNAPDAYEFKIKLTGSGTSTITYPNSVKFPDSTAPAAPADGEIDTLKIYTIDSGTTYYATQVGNNHG